MEPSKEFLDEMRNRLMQLKSDYENRVETIHEHARNPLDSDSAEQAAQLGNVAVVSALEGEAVREIAAIDAALQRIEAGTYGVCVSCGEFINRERLNARPASTECLECADADHPPFQS